MRIPSTRFRPAWRSLRLPWPRCSPASPNTVNGRAVRGGFGSMATLIIDDDPFMLTLLSRQLSRLGMTDVRCFERARDALATLQASACADGLILCDLQMPEMDGVEVIRQLGRLGYSGGLVLIRARGEIIE